MKFLSSTFCFEILKKFNIIFDCPEMFSTCFVSDPSLSRVCMRFRIPFGVPIISVNSVLFFSGRYFRGILHARYRTSAVFIPYRE